MKKIPKSKKRKKKMSKYKKRKKHKSKKPYLNAQPWQPVKMKMFQLPNLFPPEMPKEKRIEIVRSIGEKAEKDFYENFPRIQKWFNDYDAIYILSFCAFYYISSPEGIDPEAIGTLEFYCHYLEIMQALSLYQKRSYSLKPLMSDAEKLKKEMIKLGDSMQFRLLKIPEEYKTDDEIFAYKLRTDIMGNTIAVRNWAYFFQIKRVIRDLSSLIKDEFEKIYGINPVKFMELLFELAEERNILLNKHLAKTRSFVRKKNHKAMIDAYNKAFTDIKKIEGDEIEKIWNLAEKNIDNLRFLLICHSDLRLQDIFSFSLDRAVTLYGDRSKRKELESVLKKLAYEFGDLKGYEKEHIILSNPIHRRPFIILEDGNFFSAIFCILPHLALGLLEDLISENDELREKYDSKIKPKYLENEVERLFRSNFPNAEIFRGSQWKDPLENKNYQNDLLIVIDTFALVVEAKSGKVTPPAKRGAPSRLFETLKGLIEEPSEQANRFINYLKNNPRIHTFTTESGESKIIDSSRIKYFIPIGVTLVNLGTISSNLKKIIKSGITAKKICDLALSISLTDLELIFEILPFEAEKIHYFARRREIEEHLIYEGDEMDLLAFYLDNGFNIGKVEYSGDLTINMLLKSKELDPYFNGIDEGVHVSKPELSMTKWLKDLLNTISLKKPQNWIETSFILLNTTKEDQEKFEKSLNKLKNRILKGKVNKPINWVSFLSGPERRKYIIAGYLYLSKEKEERNNEMLSILNSEDAVNTRGAVIIGFDVTRNDYPYSVLAGRSENNLFDI